MDEEKDVEHQLDELFNGDFIEIDGNSANNIIANQGKSETLKNNSRISYVDSVKEEKKEITKKEDIDIKIDDNKNEESEKSNIINNQENKTKVKKQKRKHNSFPKIKSKNIYFLVAGLFFVSLILIIVFYNYSKEKKYVCNLNIKAEGYEIIDSYEITVKKRYVKTVISNYSYIALNDEYKEQVEYIKNEKIPIIINSNGMPGFTYIFEEEPYKFTVSGYLDFTLFKDINKLDQKAKPVTYFRLKENLKYKELKKELVDKGYNCK